MANNVPISQLPSAALPLIGTELVPIVQNGQTVNTPLSSIIGGGGGPVQAANKVYAGPTSGAPASPTFRSLVGADLPNPAATTLGGVKSLAAVSHQFLTSIGTDGTPTQAQPAFTDIAGSVAASQMPALTGDVTSSAGTVATTVVKLQGRAVASTAPTDLQVLAWSAGSNQWAPASLAPDFGPQTANQIFAGPSSGAAATPTFRAMVVADLPGSTGTGSTVVLSTSPTLVTPILGVATATSINKVSITAPATSATITIADTKTLTVSNSLTFTGTDGSSVNFGAGGTVLYANQTITLSGDVTGSGTTAITTTVAKIAGTTVSGTTGTTNVVFSASPTIVTPTIATLPATTTINTGSTAALVFQTNGVTQAQVVNTASAVNYLTFTGNVTNGQPIISVGGSDTNITLQINSKGTGGINFTTGGSSGYRQVTIENITSAANWVGISGNATGNAPYIVARGGDTNADFIVGSRGTGSIKFITNSLSTEQVRVTHTAGANRYITLTGANSANPTISVSAGSLLLGSGSALATNATDGFVMIPSCAGAPTGAPNNAGAGAIPMVYDTTNNKIWFYNGSWRGVAVT